MANIKPIFSIITVVYNDAENLERTINSILNQSFTDFEYIVIDGGSTDNSIQVIRKYESRITFWKSEPDKGIYDAMNKGIKAAKGRFINFLNAGDLYYKISVLQTVADSLKAHESTEVLYGQAVRLSSENSNLRFKKGGKFSTFDLFTSIPFCHQAIFYKNELFTEIGLYDTNYKVTADYQWLVRYYNRRNTLKDTYYLAASIVEYMEGGFSFKNINKAAKEKLNIARHEFKGFYRILGLLSFSAFLIKSRVIELMVRFKLLEGYRNIKYRLLNRTA